MVKQQKATPVTTDLVVGPSVGYRWSLLSCADDTQHVIETRVAWHVIVVGRLVLLSHTNIIIIIILIIVTTNIIVMYIIINCSNHVAKLSCQVWQFPNQWPPFLLDWCELYICKTSQLHNSLHNPYCSPLSASFHTIGDKLKIWQAKTGTS